MSTTTSRHAARREPRFSFLRGRKGQPEAPQAPKTAVATDLGDGFGEALRAAPLPAPVSDDTLLFRVPSPDGGPGFVLPPGPPWERPEAEEDAEAPLPVRTPGATLADVAVPVLRAEAADPDLLRELRDAIEALPCDPEPHPLPATLLRAVPRDGGDAGTKEILAGWPACSSGMRTTEAGQRVAGLCIGDASDVLVYIENPDVRWWDEFIREAMLTRDLQVYGALQAPAGEPAPAPAAGAEAVADEGEGEAA